MLSFGDRWGHAQIMNSLDGLERFLPATLESCWLISMPSALKKDLDWFPLSLLFYVCPHGSQSATFLPT